MIPAQFDYESPRNLNEALDLLSSRDDAKLLAGGHSLLPAMKLRLAAPSLLIDLGRIAGLDTIRDAGDRIIVGALTTHTAVASSKLLHDASPLLAQAAHEIGDVQVRNRGTIGGSLAGAHPAADYPAAILALDADIVALSRKGERVIPAREFFSGMFTTSLRPDEIITEVRVPKTTGAATAYKKFHHPASGYAVVGVAVVVKVGGGSVQSVAIGITGVGEVAYRATFTENALRGKPTSEVAEAAKHAAEHIDAIGDSFASAEYRKHMAEVYTRRALQQAITGKSGK
ncbi:MAG TPA: xanthine dehydrogenase family protein subunit M [Terriglobales bacterium]|nr:xanthine dehydrogenase family protein subunit M [Terriglobales bacterium]